ncbi:MAG TPA: hypothetical protein VGH33_00285, partial [Isosphaeraceae bacterium]
DGLRGRASEPTRIYDLGAEVLGRAPSVLAGHGFDPLPLEPIPPPSGDGPVACRASRGLTGFLSRSVPLPRGELP